jgi:hypothetical protein
LIAHATIVAPYFYGVRVGDSPCPVKRSRVIRTFPIVKPETASRPFEPVKSVDRHRAPQMIVAAGRDDRK